MYFEKQQYQEDCVENVIQVLENCDIRNNDFSNLQDNIGELWQKKSYTQFIKKNKNCLDVLMETGTGKTFTYLKTIFEIHKKFQKNKFIIVVPRTAIKLGVIQNIKLTRDYFYNEYKNYLKYIDYPKDGLGKIIQDFINTDDLNILITTNSAFNSEKNKINQREERLFSSGSVWDNIQNKNPIIIIDEPHLLKGKETQKGLNKLDGCLQIRFGATFPNDKNDEEHHLANVVYCLDSISAFRQNLVKGITVHTVISQEEQGGLKLSSTESKKKSFVVDYDIKGVIHRKTIHHQEDIGVKTGLSNYKNVKSTKIKASKVFFNNETCLELSNNKYNLGDEEVTKMIEVTIDKHFEKEKILFKQGIKTLSLFFIPSIADFRSENPKIKKIFEKIYQQKRIEVLKNVKDEDYKNYLKKDFDEEKKLKVHEGYFSGDKVSTKDKNSGMNKDDVGVNIILNEKEKLLSLDTPLRFIFSVWALQEGWDNPNIFNICKLSATTKDTSRRQQIGRGLRIAVNQSGHRLTYKKLGEKQHEFESINNLDVIVSGKEKEFIQAIQQEIQMASYSLVGDSLTLEKLKNLELNDIESAGLFFILQQNNITDKEGKINSSVYEFLKNQKDKLSTLNLTETRYQEILNKFTDNRNFIKDGNKGKKQVKIRAEQWKNFKILWEKINKKSRIVYKNIQQDLIIETVKKEFSKTKIEPLFVEIITKKYNAQQDKIENIDEKQEQEQINFFKIQKFNDFINFFVKKEKFPITFMVKLFNEIIKDKKNIEKIKNNPNQAKQSLLEILQDTIHGQIISFVNYQFLETKIYPNELQKHNGDKKLEIPHTFLGKEFAEKNVPEHLLYDTICFDSKDEKNIQQNDPKNINGKKITVFAKLPKISIPTPYKKYNPDFAYLIEKEDNKKLFLVVEAKDYKNENAIPIEQKKKIAYAEKFFESLKKELKNDNIEVQYKTRIKGQTLVDLIKI